MRGPVIVYGIHEHGQSIDPKTIGIEIEHNKQKAVPWKCRICRCFSFVCHTESDGLEDENNNTVFKWGT